MSVGNMLKFVRPERQQEVAQIMEKVTQSDDGQWIQFEGSMGTVNLDGEFNTEQLEIIVKAMRAIEREI